MKKNMGNTDRFARVLAAALIALLYFTNQISGVTAIVLSILAVAFVATSMVSFCPLYLPFGLSTRKKSEQ